MVYCLPLLILQRLLSQDPSTKPPSMSIPLQHRLWSQLRSLSLAAGLAFPSPLRSYPKQQRAEFACETSVWSIWAKAMTPFPCAWSLQVPCLPFLPLLSITINSILMARLSAGAWLRYLLWMAVGKPGCPPQPRAGGSLFG